MTINMLRNRTKSYRGNFMKKWRFLPILCLAGTSLLLSACKSDDVDPDGKTLINFFGWGSAEEQENFQTMINSFMEDNPDVKVSYEATSATNYSKLLSTKAKNLPDVFYMPDYDFLQWASAGKLMDISSYVSDEEMKDIWPVAKKMFRYDSETKKLGEGSALYGLAKDLGPYSLVYNKTAMEQIIKTKGLKDDSGATLSLPSATDPMSWDEFVKYFSKFKGNEYNAYPIGYYEPMHAVYSNNADFWNEDATKTAITTKNFKDAIQWIADLSLVHGIAPNAKEAKASNGYQRFLNKQCLVTFMGPWDQKAYWNSVDFDFDIMPTPYGTASGAKSTSWIGSVALSCRNFSKNEQKKKEASIRLAKYLTIGEKCARMNYQLGQAMPNIMTMAKTDWINNVGLEGRQTLPEHKNVWLDITTGNDKVTYHNRAKYYLYYNSSYDDLISNIADNVNTGLKTASQYLDEFAPTHQELLDDNAIALQD